MKTIPASKLTTIAMVVGGERSVTKVIDDGVLKEWVGISWIDVRPATKADRVKYPRVTR